MRASESNPQDTKWVFIRKGTCSRTLFTILNREFGNNSLEFEERASDPLAGGIIQQGYQCGMLWGASLAVGAEAFRRCEGCHQAIGLAINATRHILTSFANRAGTHDCYEITKADFNSKLSTAKYMLSGRFVSCFTLADKWAPEAIQAAIEGLSQDPSGLPGQVVSCASEVVRKMGGSDKEITMVAGFAGGLGLSGNACGALGAAVWMNSLIWLKKHPRKTSYSNPMARDVLERFMKASEYEFPCKTITRRDFKTSEEHTQFINNGGCTTLIDILAQS